MSDIDARVLILPSDPYAENVPLDDDAQAWLTGDSWASYDGPSLRRAHNVIASADALVRFEGPNAQPPWRRHVALYCHGGIEMASAGLAGKSHEMRVFPLLRLVGHVWMSLALFKEGAAKWGIQGPVELTVGVRGTAGATLGALAEGWAEPGRDFDGPPTCMDPFVLIRHELAQDFDVKSAAIRIGDRLENAFGSSFRRHLAREGELAGTLDTRYAL